ncbi:class I SAM-dependent methyltransferase [Sphingopyxis sp. EG6]|uniref:class I SAM-dependent methyltransferase n=1 Tax=Sphingopyxis sp. EG6 TaxID=1874061 RepID=UPI000DC639F8|nr:class I SAM-dependent methyltransferase [Sphingopyxis sp. EG6]BBB08635.1 3-demethylubiquinone-9 3-methyltransferase [Sphingopyxis sp. EG6]
MIQFGTPPLAYYDGILMRANPTLHREAFDLLRTRIPPSAKVVDVGSGQGAFAARLRDAGYHVTSIDKNHDDFRAKDIDFVCVDFDSASDIEAFRTEHEARYDVAIGMEVIEHVENPWEYTRFLLSLVKPGGVVMITTPNAESVQSRVEFLFTGFFAHFQKGDYEGSGHINPLTFHELFLISKGAGAEILDAQSVCPLPWIIVSKRLSTTLGSILGSLFRPFAGGKAKGDIICLILKKPY